MNQQEIKANLPQLPFKVDDIYGDVKDFNCDNVANMDVHSISFISRRAAGNAITHAINNTYGKGINPESVPDMFNALTLIELNLNGAIDQQVTAKTIRDILKNATL
jgi:hypothetical protein